MARHLAALFYILFFISPLHAEGSWPSGRFNFVNTGGFIQQNGLRTPIRTEGVSAQAHISLDDDENLLLDVNGTKIRLFKLKDGLAALNWNAADTALLHDVDIQALFNGKSLKDVPAWGADLAWPGAGEVRMILLPLGSNAYSGFLISHPGYKTVVRQMEFRHAHGPANRPAAPADSANR